MPPSVIRGFLRMTDVECGDLFTAIGHLPQPGSSQRAKGKCSSPRLREAWLLAYGAYLLSEREESACFWISPLLKRHFSEIPAAEREKLRHSWISASISVMAIFPAVLQRALYAGDGNTEGAIWWVCIWQSGLG